MRDLTVLNRCFRPYTPNFRGAEDKGPSVEMTALKALQKIPATKGHPSAGFRARRPAGSWAFQYPLQPTFYLYPPDPAHRLPPGTPGARQRTPFGAPRSAHRV